MAEPKPENAYETEPLDEAETGGLELHPVDKHLVAVVNDCHMISVQAMSSIHSKLADYRNQYEGNEEAERRKFYDGRANCYPNHTFRLVDTAVARYMNDLFPSRDFYRLSSEDDSSERNQQAVSDTMDHYCRLMRFRPTMLEYIQNHAIDGTAVWQTGWQFDATCAPEDYEPHDLPPDPNKKKKATWQIVDSRPDAEVVPLEDFFVPDIHVRSIDELDFCGKRFCPTWRQLYDNERKTKKIKDKEVTLGLYRNLEYVSTAQTRKESPELPTGNQGATDLDETAQGPIHRMNAPIDCVEYYFPRGSMIFDEYPGYEDADIKNWRSYMMEQWGLKKEDLERGWIVTVAQGQVPIRVDVMADPQSKLSSIFTLKRFLDRKQNGPNLFGIGIPEFVRDDQLEAAAIENQILDIVTAQLNRKSISLQQTGIPKEFFEASNPQQHYEITETLIDTMRPPSEWFIFLPVPDVPPDAWSARETLARDMENTTGIIELQQGRSPGSRVTATEAEIRMSGADTRLIARERSFEEDALEPILQNILIGIQRHVTEEVAIQILGEDGRWVSRRIKASELQGRFRFHVIGVHETSNRFTRTQQMIQVADRPIFQGVVNPDDLARRIFKALDEPNLEELIRNPLRIERMMPLEQQWAIFRAGKSVKVTGRETAAEHEMAIDKHRDFRDTMVAEMQNNGRYTELDILRFTAAIDQNIADHEWFLERLMEEMQAAQAAQGPQGGQGPPAAITTPAPPGTEQQTVAGMGQLPAAMPNAAGMVG